MREMSFVRGVVFFAAARERWSACGLGAKNSFEEGLSGDMQVLCGLGRRKEYFDNKMELKRYQQPPTSSQKAAQMEAETTQGS